MRVKTKTTIALGAVLAGALALSACSSGGNSSEGGGDAENSTPITIWVDIERKPALDAVAESFTKDTGVPVKIVTKDFANVDQDFIS